MKINIFLKVAFGSFLVGGIGVVIFAFLSFNQVSGYFKTNLLHYLSVELQSDKTEIENKIEDIKNDVIRLKNAEEIQGIIRSYKNQYKYDEVENTTIDGWKQRTYKEFKNFIEQNNPYFQIRFIGVENGGKEILRAERVDDHIILTKDEELQKKGDRYYFKNTIKLKEDEIYISKIDLNRENGHIVLPIVPTIRVSTPVYFNGKLFGIIIINADTDKLFNTKRFKSMEQKDTFLTNKNGSYLYHKDIDKTFGFDFKRDIKIQNDFKQLKNFFVDATKKELSFYTEDDVAFYIKKIFITSDYFITIARSADNIFLKEQSNVYKKNMIFYISIIALLIAVFSAILTKILTFPILVLSKKAKIIAKTKGEEEVDFSDIKTHDEIGELANSISSMVDNIVESKKELKTFALSLESEVEKRTKEQEILLSIFDKGDAVLFKWNNDEHWSIASVSQSVVKMTGYSVEEFVKGEILFANCIHQDDIKTVIDEVTKAVEQNLYFFEHKPYRIITKQGEIKWVLDHTVIVRDEKGEVTHFVGYLTDISILQELNDKLEQKVASGVQEIRNKDELLAQQSKLAAMGEMIGSIAHQWRQPLNALAVQVQFIEDDFEDGLVNMEYLDEFKQENMKLINFMSKTIDDFRNFFRVDKTKSVFDVKTKIEETTNILSSQFKSHNIELLIQGEGFKVLGFASEFQQVILNIVNNAKDILVEQEKEDGLVSILLSCTKTHGTITIKDNGGGVPLDVIDRIFEPYYTTKDQGKGTGLGLYMSKMIIEENMHGNIMVENCEAGAKFIIELGISNEK